MTLISFSLLTILTCLLQFIIVHSDVKSASIPLQNHQAITMHRDPVKMKRLAKFKFELLENINNLEDRHVGLAITKILHKFKRESQKCDNLVTDIEKGRKDGVDENIQNVVSNPIHVYNLVKEMLWFSKEVYYPLMNSSSDTGENIILSVTRQFLREGNQFPFDDDLSGAAFSLLILPITYRFHPIELVDGKLGTRETDAFLTFDDVNHIVQECLSLNKPLFIPMNYHKSKFMVKNDVKHYATAIEWMEAAELLVIRKISTGSCKDHAKWKERLEIVMTEIRLLKEMHDQNYIEINHGKYTHQTPPEEDFFIRKFNNYYNITSKEMRHQEKNVVSTLLSSPTTDSKFRIRDFLAVCRGEELRFTVERNPRINSEKEKCILTHHNEPYLYLGPLKLEIIVAKPLQLYLYHSLLTPWQINTLRSYVEIGSDYKEVEKKVSEVTSVKHVDEFEDGRNYELSWHSDNMYQPVYKISRKLDVITGMDVTSPDVREKESRIPFFDPNLRFFSFDMKIRTFTPSSYLLDTIRLHYDAAEDCLDQRCLLTQRNRIATAMFYLSTTEGGGTAFPNVGRVVYPTEGAMLFWYNLHSDGSLIDESLHSGCPVLYGIKTVANKWITYNEQIFKKPCKNEDMLQRQL